MEMTLDELNAAVGALYLNNMMLAKRVAQLEAAKTEKQDAKKEK